MQLELFINDIVEMDMINRSKPFIKFIEFDKYYDESNDTLLGIKQKSKQHKENNYYNINNNNHNNHNKSKNMQGNYQRLNLEQVQSHKIINQKKFGLNQESDDNIFIKTKMNKIFNLKRNDSFNKIKKITNYSDIKQKKDMPRNPSVFSNNNLINNYNNSTNTNLYNENYKYMNKGDEFGSINNNTNNNNDNLNLSVSEIFCYKIWLHAWTYKFENYEFKTSIPDWATKEYNPNHIF
jgi:hypothetical protein